MADLQKMADVLDRKNELEYHLPHEEKSGEKAVFQYIFTEKPYNSPHVGAVDKSFGFVFVQKTNRLS